MSRLLWLIMVMAVLAACAPQPEGAATPVPAETAAPTPTASITDQPPARLFGGEHIVGGAPIVARGEAGAWDAYDVAPGAVTVQDGTFYLFYKGVPRAGPQVGAVGLATSADGLVWEKRPEPLFTTLGLDVPAPGLMPGSVFVDETGTWVMYFMAAEPGLDHVLASIWRATAPSAAGPWSANPQPVLSRGPEGDWNDGAVLIPNIILDQGGMKMYFDGFQAGGPGEGIGLATSHDGVGWTLYDDPATTDPPFVLSDPIFQPGGEGAWDKRAMRPAAVRTPQGYVMVYMGVVSNEVNTAYGLASSADGITWTKHASNPVLTYEDVPNQGYLNEQRLFYLVDAYYLFFQAGRSGRSDIWLSIVEGDLPPINSPAPNP